MNITIFAIFKDKAKFFVRVANGFEGKHDVTFITTRYHSYRIIKQAGYKVHMLQEFIKDDISIDEFKSIEDEAILMDVKAGFLSEKRVRKQFGWLAKGFKNYFSTQKVDKFMLWNGSMLQGFTASHVADKYAIKKLFFEVGNFPNKIFVDEKGVNAKSSLMDRDLTICDNYDEEKIVKFLEDHKKKKEEIHVVPQAINNKKESKLYFLWDILYNLKTPYPILENEKGLVDFIKYRFSTKKVDLVYDKIDYKSVDYILFPLQVSIDSQIIRNSELDLEQSIIYAVNDAKENNLRLIIKPHPAESNEYIINLIKNIQKENDNVFLVNENTYLLIKYAKKVITINSTVGIESLMYYKHTEVLGEALYKKYCEKDLNYTVDNNRINRFLFNYFFNCLKDGDFFDSKEIIIS
jgi:capsular polysaccharide export protein